MQTSSPFLSPETVQSTNLCIICNGSFTNKQKQVELHQRGWLNFKKNAEIWASINIPSNEPKHRYTEVHARIKESDEAFGYVHDSCRVAFNCKSNRFLAKYGSVDSFAKESASKPESHNEQNPERPTRNLNYSKRHCFICDAKRTTDDNGYCEGGLGRCSLDSAAKRLMERKESYTKDPSHRFFQAAQRLEILLSGSSHDIFAIDVFYHQSCYLKFVFSPIQDNQCDVDKEKENDVMQAFYYKVKTKIIRDKAAFLLNELLEDVKVLSDEEGLPCPPISHTSTLKRRLIKEFNEALSFFPNGKFLLVHSSDVNPCQYAIAALHGCGLRDEDLARSFGRMIRRQLQSSSKQKRQWPLTPEELTDLLDRGPLQSLYNAIYYTMHDSAKKNEYGYAITNSHLEAIKIWSLSSDWESLLTRETSPKQAVMGLVIHRMTGSREVANMLHKCNHTISYRDIRVQNLAWARMVSSRQLLLSNMRKGVTTHSTIDNNDGRQETLTGAGTTHDTNKTLFQLPTAKEKEEIPNIGSQAERRLDIWSSVENEGIEVAPFSIGKRMGPSPFQNYKDDEDLRDELDLCFKKDIAWAAAGSLPPEFRGEELPLLGSWTPFNKKVSTSSAEKCIQEYLPVTSEPPEYPVCKEYLDFLLEILQDLEIPYIFVHSDEAVYSKLCHILWKDKELYRNVILLMGGFHQLRVRQKLLFKRHNCRGYRQWCVDAGIIASGSSDQAFEGRHYYRSMRIHKECFDALVQFKVGIVTESHNKTESEFLSSLVAVRKSPSSSTVERVINSPGFNDFLADLAGSVDGTEASMTMAYLQDVSSMLAMVSAVREGNIERHLQSEREMLKQIFAFNHQNYARYCSYQHVYLRSLQQEGHPAFEELQSKGFGASIGGEKFSSIHGDLVTELFNKETKGTAGPFRSGFSTNTEAVNTWVRTIHLHSNLHETFRKQLVMKTTSIHKELSEGGKQNHVNHVDSLKNQLAKYGVDPFDKCPPKCLSTGVQIDEIVVRDMLNAPSIGNELFKTFVEERLQRSGKGFFDPIKRVKLRNGIEKKKVIPKAVTLLKEDRQAFGLVVAKSVSLQEAFKFPITSVPLAVATTEATLRQSDKASLRNYLINECNSISEDPPKNCSWFIDGLAAVRSLQPKKTYRVWLKSFLQFAKPPRNTDAIQVGLINDTYKADSVKGGTRKDRGESGLRVQIDGFDQHMLQGNKWQEFLNSGENKEELIQLLVKYLGTEEGMAQLEHPYIITAGDATFAVRNGTVSELFRCSHEEADTRLVLHALKSDTDVVVVAKDTDVLVLMIWAYEQQNISKKWYMKYDHNKYADISEICKFLGPKICGVLPAVHALTGCDTTSYFFKVGKVKVLKKLMKAERKADLLTDLGRDDDVSSLVLERAKQFVRTVLYTGKEKETYIETRIRLYQEMKVKSSMSLPPDPDSIIQVIKRAHYQIYFWLRCTEVNPEVIPFSNNGWKWCDKQELVVPVWFTGNQLPPILRRKKCKNNTNENDADDEEGGIELKQPRKKNKRKTKQIIRNGKRRRAESPPKPCEGPSSSASYQAEDEQQDYHKEVGDTESEADSQAFSCSAESDWEVSDFLSSEDSGDEWIP